MLHKGPDAESTRRGPRILSGIQVPDFDFSVVSAGNDPLVVEPDTADKFFVAFEHSETGTAFNVPESDCVVRGSADDQVVVILETGDAAFVTVERSNKLTG